MFQIYGFLDSIRSTTKGYRVIAVLAFLTLLMYCSLSISMPLTCNAFEEQNRLASEDNLQALYDPHPPHLFILRYQKRRISLTSIPAVTYSIDLQVLKKRE